MARRTLLYIVLLMTISLIGIGVLQWHWLNQAMADQQEKFDQSVRSALNASVRDMEEQEADLFIRESFGDTSEIKIFLNKFGRSGESNEQIFIFEDDVDTSWTDQETEVILWSDSNTSDVRVLHAPETEGNMIIREVSVRDTVFGQQTLQVTHVEHKIEVIGDVMERMLIDEVHSGDPLAFRMNSNNVDSVLSANFKKEGILTPFTHAVTSFSGDSLISEYSENWKGDTATAYSTSLFPHMRTSSGNHLLVDFPDKQSYVRAQMAWMIALAIFLGLLLIATFGYTVFQIIRQKRLSQIKSDFINNMTHEFKTPLATIGLAADSIRHPKVKTDQAQIDYFTNIITEEKERLNGQVEKVLQIARMERGEIKLNPEALDFNALVEKAADTMKLQAEARHGEISITLDHKLAAINGDGAHLYNVILNLIENALKYCPSNPQVKLGTRSSEGKLEFFVEDNGVGMTKDVQKRIFETFYRAQGGNLHETKGFGLGLSYVREIIRLHNGELVVHSAPGKGSQIGFKLPAA
jgi:two-component system, OmpR family, phosphate regulon sensor histidine kinase PhoR